MSRFDQNGGVCRNFARSGHSKLCTLQKVLSIAMFKRALETNEKNWAVFHQAEIVLQIF
jgi:hypothetical protein